LAIGTSGTVHPAAGLVDDVAAVGGRSWLIDADPPASYAARFNRVITGKSGEVLPGLV
jgi:NAD-dependent SIR2 family protein deacetylase